MTASHLESTLKLSCMGVQSHLELCLCAFLVHQELLSGVHTVSSTTLDMKPNNFVTGAQHVPPNFPSKNAHAVTSGCYLLALVLSFAVLLLHTIFCFQLSWARLH